MRRGLVLALLLLPTPAAAQGRELRFGLAATCSVTMDVADFLSTIYAHQQRADVAEGNPLYANGFRGDALAWPLVLKGTGAVVVVWGGWELERRGHHVASQVLLWGNCVGKGIWTGHNLAVANDVPQPKVTLGLKVSW